MNYGFLILAGIVGIVVGIVIMMISSKAGLDKAKIEADSILEESKSKADTIVKQAQIDGQKAAFDLRQQADKEIKDRENKIQQMENRLNRDQDRLSVREENLTAKEKKLDEKGRLADAKLANISKMEADLQQKIDSQIEVLERTACRYGGLEEAFFKLDQGNDAAAVAQALRAFRHHGAVLHVDVSVEAESPYAGVVVGPLRAVKCRAHSDPGVLRSIRHAGVHPHKVEGIGIIISLHQAGEDEADLPVVGAGFSKAPAKLCAVTLADDAALAGFPTAGAVHVPLVSKALHRNAIIRNAEGADGHGTEVLNGNVPLRILRVYPHGPALGNDGAAVLVDGNVYVKVTDLMGKRRSAEHCGGNKCKKPFHLDFRVIFLGYVVGKVITL